MMNERIAWTDDDLADGRQRVRLSAAGSRFTLKRLPVAAVAVLGLVAAALVGSGVTWLFSGSQDERQAAGPPPLIKADEQPIKVYPDTPGGMDVPNRDKLVYSRLKGEGEKREVERLLPGPEAPLPPPVAATEPAPPPAPVAAAPSARSPTGSPFPLDPGRISETAPPLEDEAMALAAKPLPADPADKPVAEKPAAGKSTAAKPAEKQVATRQPEKLAEKPAADKPAGKPATAEKAAVRSAPAIAGSNRVYVQLLAARSQSDVLGAWKKLQSKNNDLLGGMAGTVAKADLGDRGVFYRLRAGPIASEAQAKSLCAALAGRNVSCLIVRPAS